MAFDSCLIALAYLHERLVKEDYRLSIWQATAVALRQRLSQDPEDGDLDERSAELLGRFVERLPEAEWQQLPLRKRRALEEMGYVLDAFQKQASKDRDTRTLERIQRTAGHSPLGALFPCHRRA
ncbi:hypothetical protein [Halorhodospira halophila]|uniref:hypothetical protein n=1 Tax=Halorhodospira halophila TaxID=1053 RepID=UPI0005A00E8A|nr:hypothetical protein [Halorhodospira halophila]MBK1729402.1 hypothetical protein [Halorhodospira halophila]